MCCMYWFLGPVWNGPELLTANRVQQISFSSLLSIRTLFSASGQACVTHQLNMTSVFLTRVPCFHFFVFCEHGVLCEHHSGSFSLFLNITFIVLPWRFLFLFLKSPFFTSTYYFSFSSELHLKWKLLFSVWSGNNRRMYDVLHKQTCTIKQW